MPEKFEFNLSGSDQVPGGKRKPYVPRVTYDGLIRFIKEKKLSQEVETILINKVKKYPNGALPAFRVAIDSHIRLSIIEASKKKNEQ